MSEWVERAEVTVEVDEVEYVVRLECECYAERVGHDADGNRSWSESFCEDPVIVGIAPEPSEEILKRIVALVEEMEYDDINWKGGDDD
jgi:hypothetical protein